MVAGMRFIRSRALLKKRQRRPTTTNEEQDVPEPVVVAVIVPPTTNVTSSTGSPILLPHVPPVAHDDVKPPTATSRECVSPDSVACFPSPTREAPPLVKRGVVTPHSPRPCAPSSRKVEEVKEEEREADLSVHCLIVEPLAMPPSPILNVHPGDSPKEETPRTNNEPPNRTVPKRVSFADKDGSPLQHVRMIEPSPTRKLLLLLLSPQDRKFEFLNLEYPLDDNTTAKVVVDQIPKLASNPLFRTFTFTSLARTSVSEQLDGDGLMVDFDLKDNELLLGIPMGYQAHQIGAFAVPLLLNGDIIKAVKSAKRSGKGLKVLQSGNEWKRRGKTRRTIPKSSTKSKLLLLMMEDDDYHEVEQPSTELSRENGVSEIDDLDGSSHFTRSEEQPSVSFTASTGDATTTTTTNPATIDSLYSPPRVADTTTSRPETTITFFQRADDALQASFSDCKAELSRLAALEPRPIPQVKSISRPGSSSSSSAGAGCPVL